MTDFLITHKTEYLYEEPASLSYNEARMIPRSFSHCLFEQRCLERQISIEPFWTDYRERLDFFGNEVLYFTLRRPHRQTIITATSRVRLLPRPERESTFTNGNTWMNSPAYRTPWETVRHTLRHDLAADILEARQYVMNSAVVTVFPALVSYAAPSFPPDRPILEAVRDLMSRIHRDFAFVPGVTTVATPLAEVLEARKGVCQDFAHLMLGCLRAQRLAARYVSGYIETIPPPGQEKLEGADASHAWVSVFMPGAGWLDFDPTNNLIPHDQHLTVAWGRDFSDVTPLKGVFFSTGDHKLQVSVDVKRLAEID